MRKYDLQRHLRDRDKRIATAAARWHAKSPLERHKRTLANHHITDEQYADLVAAQGGRCAICGEQQNIGGRGMFPIDHDHRCCPGDYSCGKCVRGLLCFHCNHLLGNARDSADILRAAAAYLASSSLT